MNRIPDATLPSQVSRVVQHRHVPSQTSRVLRPVTVGLFPSLLFVMSKHCAWLTCALSPPSLSKPFLASSGSAVPVGAEVSRGRLCSPGTKPEIYTAVSRRFALEPLLPKKMHSRSQDKLDKDDPEKDKKDKKKEKRNSKHQESFDKEFKPADAPPQQSEAVILSETVTAPRPAPLRGRAGDPRSPNLP